MTRRHAGSFLERSLPKLLRPGHKVRAHPWRDVAVDAAHARYLVAHPLRLQDLAHTQVVQPCLVSVAQAVRCQARTQRKPGSDWHGLGGPLD